MEIDTTNLGFKMNDNAQKDLILKKSLLKDEVKHIDIMQLESYNQSNAINVLRCTRD